jgi:hypothetical protein
MAPELQEEPMQHWTPHGIVSLLAEEGPSTWEDLEWHVPQARMLMEDAMRAAKQLGLVEERLGRFDVSAKALALREMPS